MCQRTQRRVNLHMGMSTYTQACQLTHGHVNLHTGMSVSIMTSIHGLTYPFSNNN